MELSEIDQLTNGTISQSITFAPFGLPVLPEEIAARLSSSLYEQLSEGNVETTNAAITRAQVYVGAILRRLSVAFDLADTVIRELVLIHTIYELHISLGHEEAGREYRLRARDIILAAYGEYPDTDSASGSAVGATAVIKKPVPRSIFGW